MTLDDGITRLIGDIYASPVDEEAWKRVLDQLLTRTGSRLLFVSAVDLNSKKYSKTLWHGVDSGRALDGFAEYEQEQFRWDPLLSYAARNPNAGFAEIDEALRHLGHSPETEAFQRFISGQVGIGQTAVCYTKPNEDLTLGVSISPSATAGTFRPEQLDLFKFLFGHLQRANRLAARPPVFASTRDIVILLNERGLVVSASAAAEHVLAKADGLLVIGRRLHGARPADTRRIDALISNTTSTNIVGGGGGAIAIERPSGGLSWILSADYIPRGTPLLMEFGASISIRIIERPLQSSSDIITRIAQLFSLSPTEARVLSAVFGDDLDLRDAADQLELTYSTARVHMRHILGKAEVRSQAALARLIQKIEG